MGGKLGYNKMEDWYNISAEDIENHGANLLLQYYDHSPSKAVMNAFPDYNWMTWKFKIVPRGYWEHLLKDTAEQKRVIEWLSEQFYIENKEDWYRTSLQRIQKLVMIRNAEDLATILQNVYPDHTWDTQRL